MPEPPNVAEGSVEDGAGEVSGSEHCAHCKDHHRRVSTGSYVTGGYGAGGEADSHGGLASFSQFCHFIKVHDILYSTLYEQE